MKRLTDVQIRVAHLKARAVRRDLADGAVPGLTLRLARGHATWSLVVRVTGEGGVSKRGHPKKGKRVRVTVGEYPAVSLEAARGIANTFLDQARKGVSPVKALEAVATAGGMTIKALAERFLSDYVRMKQLRAFVKYEGALRVHVVPRVGDVLADMLSREQVRELLKRVMVRAPRKSGSRDRARGGKEAARTVLAVLRKMISWGTREEVLRRKDNPASGMESNLPKKRKKDRALSLEEARIVWRAAQTLGYPFGPTYQLILLTGCRPGEWARAQRPWIDLKQALCVIPAERYKSDHVHVLPLVSEAVSILEEVFRDFRGRSGDYIFSGTDGRKPLAGWPITDGRSGKSAQIEVNRRVQTNDTSLSATRVRTAPVLSGYRHPTRCCTDRAARHGRSEHPGSVGRRRSTGAIDHAILHAHSRPRRSWRPKATIEVAYHEDLRPRSRLPRLTFLGRLPRASFLHYRPCSSHGSLSRIVLERVVFRRFARMRLAPVADAEVPAIRSTLLTGSDCSVS
jgi:hypothetical protein